MLLQARIPFAMAKDHLFWPPMAKVHSRYGTCASSGFYGVPVDPATYGVAVNPVTNEVYVANGWVHSLCH